MTEAAIYTRVSSREQQQEGFSLCAQSRLLREYAETNRFRIVQAFEDVETAKATGRKQFAKLVDFFRRNHSCRVLLVEKTDRISRNFRDAVTLEDLDIAVHFVKEGASYFKGSAVSGNSDLRLQSRSGAALLEQSTRGGEEGNARKGGSRRLSWSCPVGLPEQ